MCIGMHPAQERFLHCIADAMFIVKAAQWAMAKAEQLNYTVLAKDSPRCPELQGLRWLHGLQWKNAGHESVRVASMSHELKRLCIIVKSARERCHSDGRGGGLAFVGKQQLWHK